MDSPTRRSRRLAGLPPSESDTSGFRVSDFATERNGSFMTPDRYPNGVRRQPTLCTNVAGFVAGALGTLMVLRAVAAAFVPN
jgi:hypothetical protein